MVLIFYLIYLEGGLVFLALHDSLYELDVIEGRKYRLCQANLRSGYRERW